MGVLSVSRLPALFRALQRFLARANHVYLFGDTAVAPSVEAQNAFRLVCHAAQVVPPLYQTHGLKRGTVSVLKRLGMTVEDINLHCGWSLFSTSF